MKRRCNRSRSGLAAVATLMLLLVLMSLIAVMVRANMMERRRTLYLEDRFRASALAERGVADAVKQCAAGEHSGALSDTGTDWSLKADWSSSPAQAGTVIVRSEVLMDRGEFEPVRVALRVGLRLGGTRPEVVSWTEE